MEKVKKIPVSVVITLLNEAATVRSLIKGLQSQTLLPTEIVFVDGGSTDSTLTLLEQFAAEWQDVSVVVTQKSGNRSVGRNQGIRLATMDVIAITDAGCIPEPNWLKELWQTYTQKNVRVVSGYAVADPLSNLASAIVPYVLVMPDKLHPESFLPATRSMLLEKQAWTEVGGFDEMLSDNEDYAFARRLQQKQVAMAFSLDARVEWLPPRTLRDFWRMIFRFARGDAFAHLWRPKVGLIFARYICLLFGSMVWLSFFGRLQWFLLGLSLLFTVYGLWAIQKNKRYVPSGWWWLPVLQLVSDQAVMAGSLVGWWRSRMRVT